MTPGTEPDLSSFATLREMIARLRGPDGCPWDRSQTHASVKPYVIEEAYEVLQAIEQEDAAKLCEELGDLLLQIMLHAQMAAEAGRFSVADVIEALATKLIRRHPHVFGEAQAADAREVALRWEAIKREERQGGASILSSVPTSMTPLSYSQAIQRRASQVGFDWPDIEGVLEKVGEELQELRLASDPGERTREFGDVLFALANVGRWLGVDAEHALRQANLRFYRRFARMEEVCSERGLSLHQLSLEQMDALWEEAKRYLGE